MTGLCLPSCSRLVKSICHRYQSKSKQTSSWRVKKTKDRWSLKMKLDPILELLMTRIKALPTWPSTRLLKLTTRVALPCVMLVACKVPQSTTKVCLPPRKLHVKYSREEGSKCWPRTVDLLKIMGSLTRLNPYQLVRTSLC